MNKMHNFMQTLPLKHLNVNKHNNSKRNTVMKSTNYIIAILFLILSTVLTSCERNDPDPEEIAKIKEWLCNKDWGLEKKVYFIEEYIENELNYSIKDTLNHTLYESSVWRFSKKKLSVTKWGDFKGCEYRLELDESDSIQIFFTDEFDYAIMGIGPIEGQKYYIYGVGSDSLIIRFYRGFNKEIMGNKYYTYSVEELYFRELDYEAHEKEITEQEDKIAAKQKKMKGEWYFDRYSITTDYREGYSDQEGQTHTEKEVKNSEPYYAVKINCENAPATDDKPSTFKVGWYENGKATYSITPSNYGLEGHQWYTVDMLGEDTLYVYFRNFQLGYSGEKYTLRNKGVCVVDITDDCIIMERDEYKKAEDNKTIIADSHVKEYWMRQK